MFYDGVCGLCDRSVQVIIKHDRKRVFRYAALQSNAARQLLGEPIAFDSFILFENGNIYTRSTAALRVVRKMGGIWSLLYAFIIIPRFSSQCCL